MKHLLVSLFFVGVFLFFVVAPANAAASLNLCPEGPGANFKQLCTFNFDNVGNILRSFIYIILVIAVVIALFYLIWGGIKWIVSGGDKAGVETARNHIIAALIGLAVAFLAFFLLQFILGFFGITFDDIKFSPLSGVR